MGISAKKGTTELKRVMGTPDKVREVDRLSGQIWCEVSVLVYADPNELSAGLRPCLAGVRTFTPLAGAMWEL